MTKDIKTAVIIAAAGSGKRMGGVVPKQYGTLGGMSILARSVKAFHDLDEIHLIIIVTNEDYRGFCREELDRLGLLAKVGGILPGGKERQDSVYEAISSLRPDIDLVLVHDGVRPFVTKDVILRNIEAAEKYGAAVVAVPVKDTIKVAEENLLTKTLDRSVLYSMQTPQGFRKDLLVHAYEKAFRENCYGTDDAFLVENAGGKVYITEGDYNNIKITTAEDIVFGEAILKQVGNPVIDDPGEIRIGTGYDVHKLVEGRKLILGGVDIPFEKGLLGYSDSDVLTHAIMDGLLGAAALGDIGRHFPDSDERYRGISSLKLLEEVGNMLGSKGFCIANIDAVVIAEKPKVAPHADAMIRNIAETLGIEPNKINIKGTTTEGLGFCGRGDGIAAQASVLIRRHR